MVMMGDNHPSYLRRWETGQGQESSLGEMETETSLLLLSYFSSKKLLS